MRTTAGALGFAFLLGVLPPATGAADDDDALGFERTPPRLSLVDGEVSFWRSGAADWAPARVNTPLAAGDELYAGDESSLEVQVGSRAYVRAGERTQLGVSALEPDYLQIRVARGTASLDLRALVAGTTFEIATPHGAFTIERTGYYRVDVNDTTRMSSRRGGWASVTTANGASAMIAPSEQIVISGADEPVLETYAAPPIDDWDRWNYARTDSQIEAQSSRYVPAGVYGVDDLDHYGSWRVVPTYGPVWVPRVVSGWVPYSAGDWIYDPYYGWTWVDDAPWGWAPFHYGRWVFVSGFWAWCPGPRVVRVYYAPALVAFYGTPTLSIAWGPRHFGWVALGWGEPLVPWWGPSHWRHKPRWGGWGGPRVVNNVVVNKTTVVNVTHITNYVNASHKGAVVAIDRGDFGRRRVHDARLAKFDPGKLRPLGDREFGVKPSPRSLVGTDRRAKQPPRGDVERRVVTTREPRRAAVPELDPRNGRQKEREARRSAEVPSEQPPARVVRREPSGRGQVPSTRPPFGQRGDEPRVAPAPAPRFEDVRERRPTARSAPEIREAPPTEPGERSRSEREAPIQRREQPETRERREARVEEPPRRSPAQIERAEPAPRERQTRSELPGEPANRVYRGERAERPQSRERAERRERSEPRESAPPAGAAEPSEPHRERPERSQGRRSERDGARDQRH